MSWDVYLCDSDSKEPLGCEPFEDGGTYVLGGSPECWLNVTYNYGAHIREALGFPFGELHGKTASEVTDALEKAVAMLGTERDADYWKPTPGNAGAALARLLAWARAYPEGVFDVY